MAGACRKREFFDDLENFTGGSYGKKFKEDVRRYYGSFMGFSGRGEMIPNEDSYCEIDPDKKDAWGIPVLRFHFKWSEHEIRQAAHMQKTFAEIIEAMGGKVLSPPERDGRKAIAPGGSIIHEVGTTCMGDRRQNFRAQPILPGVGREKSVCDRRRAVRVKRGQKSHADHHGQCVAGV